MGQNSVYCCAPSANYSGQCMTAGSGGYFQELDVTQPPQKSYRQSLRQSSRALELPVSDMVCVDHADSNNESFDTYTRIKEQSVASHIELLALPQQLNRESL